MAMQPLPPQIAQLPDELKRRLFAAMQGQQQQQRGMFSNLMAQGQPQQQPGQAVMPGRGPNMTAPAAPGLPQMTPQQQQLPGSTPPEQAAAAQYEARLKAQQQPIARSLGGPAPVPPLDQGANTNMFAGIPDWYPGMFDTLKKTSPFSGFYTDAQQSQSWL